MKRVVIIQKSLVQYRTRFFSLLRDALIEEDIDLTLIYGKQGDADFQRKDQVNLEWGMYIPNVTLQIGNRKLIWQPCLKELKDKDLVIVEQANKLLLNYFLMLARRPLGIKFCYWGHGRNMMHADNSPANRFKYLFLKECDWWFAYTEEVKSFLIRKGYPESRITAVQNAIDTRSLMEQYAQIDPAEIEKTKVALNIKGNHIGIFCGAMYPEKQIDFILKSCQRIRNDVKDFHMIFLGAGEDAHKVMEASHKNDWVHYMGPQFGQDRIKYFKIASIQLMPGAVGLGVLDSFALATPLISAYQSTHGPEIAYLENAKNGIITKNNVEDYTAAVIDTLRSEKYVEMTDYCIACAKEYTIEKMVENFKTGVLKAIAFRSDRAPKYKSHKV